MTAHLLLGYDELAEREGREFSVEDNGRTLDLFVIRCGTRVYAYENACPHRGVNLNWQPGRFLNMDETHLQCSMHGALFEITTGYCVWGPCLGRSLRALAVEIAHGNVTVDT